MSKIDFPSKKNSTTQIGAFTTTAWEWWGGGPWLCSTHHPKLMLFLTSPLSLSLVKGSPDNLDLYFLKQKFSMIYMLHSSAACPLPFNPCRLLLFYYWIFFPNVSTVFCLFVCLSYVYLNVYHTFLIWIRLHIQGIFEARRLHIHIYGIYLTLSILQDITMLCRFLKIFLKKKYCTVYKF